MCNRYTKLYTCTHETYLATKPCEFSIAIGSLDAHKDALKIAVLKKKCRGIFSRRKVLIEEECKACRDMASIALAAKVDQWISDCKIEEKPYTEEEPGSSA